MSGSTVMNVAAGVFLAEVMLGLLVLLGIALEFFRKPSFTEYGVLVAHKESRRIPSSDFVFPWGSPIFFEEECRFFFLLDGREVSVKVGPGFYSRVPLGGFVDVSYKKGRITGQAYITKVIPAT